MMEGWLWSFVCILTCIIVLLSAKICFLKKAAEEIREGIAEKLMTETNTVLTISTRDKHMRRLADDLNTELCKLSEQRHLYRQGDRELKESVANLSHDIRTPLTAICGYLELLKAAGQGETERYLDIIENRVEVLKKLTDELFHYSVILSTDRADIDLENSFEEVILNHALEESISAYYAVLKANKIEPMIRMPNQKILCYAKKDAVSRIFENVISNAVKYSEGDLQITLSENGEITFANHTSALDEVSAGKLFDRFYTVDSARKSTGLGLSIAKALTEQMGGSIFASYQKNVLCIHIRLC